MNAHRKELRRLYQAGRWFMVCRDFFAAFTIEEAAVLSYLCNVGDQRGATWFKCSVPKMLWNLRITNRVHDRIMNALVKKGAIARKQVGKPPKRYICINYNFIESAVQAALTKPFGPRR